jgi:hypothetical protein
MLKGSKNRRKPRSFEFNETERAAYRGLKGAFLLASLLRHFNPKNLIRLETDTSNKGIARILLQPDVGGLYHPVAFWSRKFSGPELNYATPNQELFAIVYSFQH